MESAFVGTPGYATWAKSRGTSWVCGEQTRRAPALLGQEARCGYRTCRRCQLATLSSVMVGDPGNHRGTELYEALRAKQEKQLAELADLEATDSAAQPKKSWWQRFDDAAWDLFQGAKERKWSPDRRPEALRGMFDIASTSLSWNRWDPFHPETGELSEQRQALSETENPCFGPNPPEYCSIEDFSMLSERSRDKDEVSDSLELQVGYVADFVDMPRSQAARQCSGRELAELCFRKYGYYHDIAVLQSKPFGDEDRQVAVNIYGPYLGLPDFPFTEEQYLQKLDELASMLNAFDQAWFVKAFLREPVFPRRGLPSRPRFDTAVTLRLNTSPTWKYLSEEIVGQYFTY